jgi:hypothetical protein
MLGPVRFTHIETCVREVCRDFKVTDEMEDTVRTLRTLDTDLAKQRATLAALTDADAANRPASSTVTLDAHKPTESLSTADGLSEEPQLGKRKRPATEIPDYNDLLTAKDVKKARRLITARENALKSVKALIKKKTEEASAEVAPPAEELDASVDKSLEKDTVSATEKDDPLVGDTVVNKTPDNAVEEDGIS